MHSFWMRRTSCRILRPSFSGRASAAAASRGILKGVRVELATAAHAARARPCSRGARADLGGRSRAVECQTCGPAARSCRAVAARIAVVASAASSSREPPCSWREPLLRLLRARSLPRPARKRHLRTSASAPGSCALALETHCRRGERRGRAHGGNNAARVCH